MPFKDKSKRTRNSSRWNSTPKGRRSAFEAKIKHWLGITTEDLARKYEEQSGKCDGCGTLLRWDYDTCIDHDHSSGKFRGLLCRPCNNALGLVRESEDTMIGLIGYVRKYKK